MFPALTGRSARIATLAALLSAAVPAVASAQATRTWVSGVGDDANPCSRTAPCKTFAGAISKTAAGGEIDVLDDGGFGAVTITKSITIDGGHHTAGIVSAGTNGVIINAAPTDKVTLRNLSIDGVNTGLNGVRILEARTVRIEKTTIFNVTQSGVDYNVSTGGTHRLEIRDTIINNAAGAALWDRPTNGATGKATVTHSAFDDNGAGIFADATAGRPKITVTHSSVDDNVATAAVNASGVGIQSTGADASVRLSDNSITGNSLGIGVTGGGIVQSFGDNVITANEVDGAPTGRLALS